MGKGSGRRPGVSGKFEEGYDRIFGGGGEKSPSTPKRVMVVRFFEKDSNTDVFGMGLFVDQDGEVYEQDSDTLILREDIGWKIVYVMT